MFVPADIAPSPITAMTLVLAAGAVARYRHRQRREIEVEEWAAPNGDVIASVRLVKNRHSPPRCEAWRMRSAAAGRICADRPGGRQSRQAIPRGVGNYKCKARSQFGRTPRPARKFRPFEREASMVFLTQSSATCRIGST